MDYSINDLEKWNDKIEIIAKESDLNYYPQEFEIVNFNEMIAYEAYSGMPSRYPHWSFGKSFEKTKTLHKYNLTGLPYEMVINSDPCIAYLMNDNTLLLQILTMAHVYGHNDFFKNNRLFKEGTKAYNTLEMFKNHGMMIRNYINDPSIGYDNVEKMLNAAHSIRFQVSRTMGQKRKENHILRQEMIDDYKESSTHYSILEPRVEVEPPDFNKIPLQSEDNILYFISVYSDLEDWQKNIINIVREESQYFAPQIETKIMNEGWASYWHYNILKKLQLPPPLHLEFIKRHNDVVRPILGGLNPYHLGFEIFCDLKERYGEEKIFEVREFDRDASFIRRYLTQEICEKLNLFEYCKQGYEYITEKVADEDGWELIRNTLADSAGMGSIPYIRVIDMSKKEKILTLEHVYDGRELQAKYLEETLRYVQDLWGRKVLLKTKHKNESAIILCDEQKNIKFY